MPPASTPSSASRLAARETRGQWGRGHDGRPGLVRWRSTRARSVPMANRSAPSPLADRRIMSAEECARLTVRAMTRRQRLAILSLRGRFGRWLRLLAPSVIDGMARRAIAAARRRRRWLGVAGEPRLCLASIAAVSLAILGGCRDADRPLARLPPPRNVVLVVADALRADHLPTYGYARDTAPFLAGLARELALDGYSASSWTRPAVSTLLTGLEPQRRQAVTRADVLPPSAPSTGAPGRRRSPPPAGSPT